MKESYVQKLVKVFIFLYINFDGNSLKNCDIISLPAKIDDFYMLWGNSSDEISNNNLSIYT